MPPAFTTTADEVKGLIIPVPLHENVCGAEFGSTERVAVGVVQFKLFVDATVGVIGAGPLNTVKEETDAAIVTTC